MRNYFYVYSNSSYLSTNDPSTLSWTHYILGPSAANMGNAQARARSPKSVRALKGVLH